MMMVTGEWNTGLYEFNNEGLTEKESALMAFLIEGCEGCEPVNGDSMEFWLIDTNFSGVKSTNELKGVLGSLVDKGYLAVDTVDYQREVPNFKAKRTEIQRVKYQTVEFTDKTMGLIKKVEG